MKKRFLWTIIAVCVVIFVAFPISARANTAPAIGAQLGFVATGVVVDLPLGPLAVNAGVNYPIGWSIIAALAGGSDQFIAPFFTVTADVTYPVPLGDNFDLKFGINTVAATDFTGAFYGLAGGAIKGEYWIPNKDTGLFVNLNVPVILYMVQDGQSPEFLYSPWLTLAGLLTTTAGILYRF